MFFQLWGDYWQSVGKDWGVTLYLGTRTFPCLASGREGGSGIKLHVVYIRVHVSVWQCYLRLHLGLLPLCSYRISRLSTTAGLTSAQPSRHIFPVHRAQRWHVQAKARNVSPDQSLESYDFCLYYSTKAASSNVNPSLELSSTNADQKDGYCPPKNLSLHA